MACWLWDLGRELRAAATMTQASETLQAWGPCESPFLTNVPPIWNDTVLRQVLVTQGTWLEDFVLHICRFHMGDIRSTPRCQRWQSFCFGVESVPFQV